MSTPREDGIMIPGMSYALIWFTPDGMRERGFPTYESADRWAMDHIHPFDSPTGGSTVPNIDDSLFSDDFINYAGREYVGGLYARRVNRYAVIVRTS